MAASQLPPEQEANQNLITGLLRLHGQHDTQHDTTARGKLANLRYALRDHLRADYRFGNVIPALPGGCLTDDDDANEWRTVVAGLFGFAHDDLEQRDGVSLGRALRELYDRRSNDSLERRFMTLLNSDAEHLPGHLRQAVSLLKAEAIGLDWRALLYDVNRWDHVQKPTQRRWIRDYYRNRAPESPEAGVIGDAVTDNAFTTETGEQTL